MKTLLKITLVLLLVAIQVMVMHRFFVKNDFLPDLGWTTIYDGLSDSHSSLILIIIDSFVCGFFLSNVLRAIFVFKIHCSQTLTLIIVSSIMGFLCVYITSLPQLIPKNSMIDRSLIFNIMFGELLLLIIPGTWVWMLIPTGFSSTMKKLEELFTKEEAL